MKNKASYAFTLIELMVVVTIIVFLASLAIPSYFKQLAKAKQAEVAINLASLCSAEQIFFAENGRYTDDLKELSWEPRNVYYTYGFNTEQGSFIGKQNAPSSELKKSKVAKGSFIASAAADLQGKGKVDIWTIDENRTLVHLQNGVN